MKLTVKRLGGSLVGGRIEAPGSISIFTPRKSTIEGGRFRVENMGRNRKMRKVDVLENDGKSEKRERWV